MQGTEKSGWTRQSYAKGGKMSKNPVKAEFVFYLYLFALYDQGRTLKLNLINYIKLKLFLIELL